MSFGSGAISSYNRGSDKDRMDEFAHDRKMFELDDYFVLGHCCRCGVPPKLLSKSDSNGNRR